MLKIGHRGRPGQPRREENTMRSFRAALAAGADALELDLRQTKDGKIVVFHDLSVERTTNGRGNIPEFSYAELALLDAGGEEHVPLFAEVLGEFAGKCVLMLELKEAGIEKPVKAEILAKVPAEVLKSIFVAAVDEDDNDPDANSSWYQLEVFAPEIPIALLAQAPKVRKIGERALIEKAAEYGARALQIEDAVVSPSLVEYAHSRDLQVWVWIVNEPTEIHKFMAMGVDGIMSDFVERLP